ncbi:hypothetical protein AC579_7047 [Pseudocercospora musae]|uniref:Heterokaryon incompatibility domain-containing protein n=1 Tax=Pseudocercospora musae TaxID=113226 RepID=A0A139IA94_9PEZI|nr:hypothetical protein AC579_7047 [Pseudocercospora musae]
MATGQSVISPYQYEPLSRPAIDSKQIRLVTLHHGELADEIVITISVQDIHVGISQSHPAVSEKYEALSYTWGSDTQTRENVTVQTGSEVRHLEIYENLFTILQTPRLSDRDRMLWIDAICINQDESDDQARLEKSWQIPMMHEVYGAASRVIIWLGPEADDSTFALAFLRVLGENFAFDLTTLELTSQTRSEQAVFLWNNWGKGFTHDRREHKAVAAVLHRPWFTRVWIRQEAFAAPDSSLVMCGTATITLGNFRNAIQVLSLKGFDAADPNHERNLVLLTTAASVFYKGSMSILETLARLRGAQCWKPQDKIYGCLGMIKLATDTAFVDTIPTNYPKTAELFKQFCVQYLQFFGNIQFLYQAGLCQRSPMQGPSWMPDWTVDFTRLDLSLERAVSHAMRADASFIDNDILRVKGVFVAEVTQVATLEQTGSPTAESSCRAVESLAKVLRKFVEPGNEAQLDAFGKAFCTALLWLRTRLEKIEAHRRDFKCFLADIIKEGKLPPYVDVRDHNSIPVLQSTIYFFQKRQLPFLSTKSGHIGIGAEDTQPGDLIAAVLGLKHLILIRPTESAGKYQLVGSCFMHGFNCGEALLGPLPPDTTLVPRLTEAQGIHESYYKNEKTGDSTFWDPRIDWTKLTPCESEQPQGEPRRRKLPDVDFLKTYHDSKILDMDMI